MLPMTAASARNACSVATTCARWRAAAAAGFTEPASAREKPDLGHLAREIDDRLARRVAGADQRQLLPGAELPFERRGPVVDGRGFELGEIGSIEAAVSGAARDHDGAGVDALVAGEAQLEPRVGARGAAPQTHHFVGYRHLGAELLRLVVRARHERHTGNPGGEAHVVLDSGP